ncbi:MAG: MFS transporter [Candidatus Heimdallarchaeota archaeon]|nr:MFS transporter [Candidatus Heimdallarchaeota archaeon]
MNDDVLVSSTQELKEEEIIHVATQNSFKQYMFFWSAQRLSILGSSVVQFVIIWWITITTQSELLLGLASLIGFGPAVLLSPFAGVLVDRLNRKMLIVVSDALQGIAALALVILFMTNTASLWAILLILGIRACFAPFHNTTINAIVPTMVPKDKLSRLNGLNFFVNGIISVLGPVLGALLLAVLDIGWVLWIDIITLLLALIPLAFILIPSVEKVDQEKLKVKTVFTDIAEGVRTLAGIKGLISLLIVFMLCNFFITPFSTLLPLFVEKIHLGTEADYAIVTSFMQAAMIIGGLAMVIFKGFKKKNILVCYLSIMWTFVFISILPWVPIGRFWLMGGVLFVTLLVIPVINVTINTTFQVLIPQDKFGRASSALGTITSAITPLGMVLAGIIGELVGIKLVFICSPIIAFVIVNILWVATPIRKLDKTITKRFEELEEIEQEKAEKEEQIEAKQRSEITQEEMGVSTQEKASTTKKKIPLPQTEPSLSE